MNNSLNSLIIDDYDDRPFNTYDIYGAHEFSSNDVVPPLKNNDIFQFHGYIEDIHVSKPLSLSEVDYLCTIASIATEYSAERPFVFKCVRRCDLAMTSVWFHIEIFQTNVQNELHVQFYYIDGSYQFFQSTFYMFKKYLINASYVELQGLQHEIVRKDLEILEPHGCKLLHFGEIISTDCESFSKVHPGILKPPSLSEVADDWDAVLRFAPKCKRSSISIATNYVLKGTPVPSHCVDFIINSFAQNESLCIEVMGFLVAAITCDPIPEYENPDGSEYKLEIHPDTLVKITRFITSSKGELFKRHALRFLFAAAIRRPTYDALFNADVVSFLNDASSFLWESNKMFCHSILQELNREE